MTHIPAPIVRDLEGERNLSRLSGQPFLDAFVKWLRSELNVMSVNIGEVSNSGGQIRLIAQDYRDSVQPRIDSYSTNGTPCNVVLREGQPVCVHQAVQDEYPNDIIFKDLGVNAYQGIPLKRGEHIAGVLCVMEASTTNLSANTLAKIEWWQPRIETELSNIQTLRYADEVAAWIALTNDNLFNHLASFICDALQVTTAFISQWSDLDRSSFYVRSFFHEGESRADFDGVLLSRLGAPCQNLDEEDEIFIRTGLSAEYPDVDFIQALGLDAYYGVVLRNEHGTVLGHIAIMHTHPMRQSLHESPLMRIYIARATAELECARWIREREALEATLVTSKKLESVGLMAGAIAHDYNNLLQTILGNADLAMRELGGGKAVTFVERIQSAAVQAGDMVSILLDYAGRKPGQRTVTNAVRLVENSLSLITLSNHPGVDVATDFPSATYFVEVDQTQVQQVLINLVLNAAESIEGNGQIEVTVTVSERDLSQDMTVTLGRELGHDTYLSISVADTGKGMDLATTSRMFDPFFSRKEEGRGLGLSVVQGVVRSHNAALAVRSAPGIGTTLSLLFKTVPAPDPSNDSSENPEAEVTGIRLILIDDEESVRTVASAMLEASGYDVVSCASGEEAVRYVASNDALKDALSAAVIDVSMPGMDGWTTLEKLREIVPDLPIVMMSGFTSDQVTERIAGQRNIRFLAKPFSIANLVESISSVTGVETTG